MRYERPLAVIALAFTLNFAGEYAGGTTNQTDCLGKTNFIDGGSIAVCRSEEGGLDVYTSEGGRAHIENECRPERVHGRDNVVWYYEFDGYHVTKWIIEIKSGNVFEETFSVNFPMNDKFCPDEQKSLVLGSVAGE